jgi:hypothetical protein
MIKITPRFFVLPLIALAVIASLPRPAAHAPMTQGCLVQAAPASGIVRADIDQASCAAPQQVVLASQQALVR